MLASIKNKQKCRNVQLCFNYTGFTRNFLLGVFNEHCVILRLGLYFADILKSWKKLAIHFD